MVGLEVLVLGRVIGIVVGYSVIIVDLLFVYWVCV